MITPAALRKLALSLPGAEEHPHWGNPSFRVRGKIFATMNEAERRATLKMSVEERETIAAAAPEVFEVLAWGNQGWTRVDLRRVDRVLIEELLTSAWRRLAPKRVVAAFDAASLTPRRPRPR
jgi:hypothetical protein